jgi:hypothetical protein
MSEDNVARLIGGIYFSLLAGLDRDGATTANEYLWTISRSPYMRPDEKRFFAFLAENASSSAKQNESRQFQVIPGGLSA